MLIYTKEEHINFLKYNILEPITSVFESENQTILSFLLMGQAIEILGAYLDYKPFRVKQQSSKRFELAIYKLFPKKYSEINKSNYLYYQLRNFLIHSFLPSNQLILVANSTKSEKKHLSYKNNNLILCCDVFYNDFKNAIYLLINKITEDNIKLKKIIASEIF